MHVILCGNQANFLYVVPTLFFAGTKQILSYEIVNVNVMCMFITNACLCDVTTKNDHFIVIRF